MIIGLILEGLALILLFPKLFSLVPLNTSLWILMAVVSVIFFLVYAFVWLSSLWLDKQDEKKINRALDAIRDEE